MVLICASALRQRGRRRAHGCALCSPFLVDEPGAKNREALGPGVAGIKDRAQDFQPTCDAASETDRERRQRADLVIPAKGSVR